MRGQPSAPLLAVLFALFTILAASAGPALAAEGGPGGPPPSVRIKPLMVPVVNGNRIEKYTQIEVNLEIADALRLGEVQLSIPRLQDAILTAIYKGIEEGWIVRGNIANVPALRRRIDESVVAMFGKDVVSRILITPVARQSSL
ncbi:hypothetical protein [Azospirillum picis]|uniref:Flagellar basal body-associated FliL family protein n=1 Tax=Azospirillum picis TaxID=488438 RepID=A0ABU0MEK4_9PROT|nr:hypothetical protein [Azospirillum picis]MBP2298030.1 hypothetical protein [Azospirillum picis]MDQ0531868.1 hypothetical protein [Azospirillum picis]